MRQKCAFCMGLLAMVLVSGCARKPDDTALVTNIKSQMFSDAALKDSNLQVTSKNGEVTLAGSVEQRCGPLRSVQDHDANCSVSKVNDQMTVQTAQNAAPPAEAAPTPPPAPVADDI